MVFLLQDYILFNKISCGNIGCVYLAYHKDSLQKFAIKTINLSSKNSFARYDNEKKILKLCNHKNIIHIYDDGIEKINTQQHYKVITKNVGFIVLHFLDYSIKDYIQKYKHISEIQSLIWARDIISALIYLDELGIVHRDLSPSNIMIKNNRAYIIDFGSALIKKDKNNLCPSTIVGTLNHVSPEQIINPENHSILNDIYSLGSIIYYMLTQKYIHGPVTNITSYIKNKKYSFPEQLYFSNLQISQDLYELIINMTKPIKHRIYPQEALNQIKLILVQLLYKKSLFIDTRRYDDIIL